MPKTIAQAFCWSAIAFSLVWLIAGQNGGIVFQNPLATIGVALIGMGLIKHFGPSQAPKTQPVPIRPQHHTHTTQSQHNRLR